jgi:hypothetical protein
VHWRCGDILDGHNPLCARLRPPARPRIQSACEGLAPISFGRA